ncbi:MAG: ABC transporter ATP-binding protein [FCB group bacterium]
MAIQVRNISKSYEKVSALDNISFDVGIGELFGLIGPDGAGKTTLFRIITTLLLADKGEVKIGDYDVVKDYKKIRNNIGYMAGKFSLYQDLTVEENLRFYATIFGTTINENYDLIKDIYKQIEPFNKRPAGKLSGGMKQKLALSCALIHKPDYLILDEPTTGVDAVSRKEFWEMLKNLKAKGITIVVSTPYMDEASLCDRVALIQQGKIMSIETPENIIKQFKTDLLGIKSNNMYQLSIDLKNYPNCKSVYPFGQYLHYTDNRLSIKENELNEYLSNLNHNDIEINKLQPNIEDCFIELMSNKELN